MYATTTIVRSAVTRAVLRGHQATAGRWQTGRDVAAADRKFADGACSHCAS